MTHRAVLAGVGIVAVAIIAYEMVRSLTPATHPDHDHALESIDAGGALRVEAWDGKQRNLVGRPGHVLVLHWFTLDSKPAMAEMPALLDFARLQQGSSKIEIVLIAAEASWDRLVTWANDAGVPGNAVFLDPDLATGRHFGVKQLPDTLVYDPSGRLAHHARGALDWAAPGITEQILAFGESPR